MRRFKDAKVHHLFGNERRPSIHGVEAPSPRVRDEFQILRAISITMGGDTDRAKAFTESSFCGPFGQCPEPLTLNFHLVN
jgi:hypothetical protein